MLFYLLSRGRRGDNIRKRYRLRSSFESMPPTAEQANEELGRRVRSWKAAYSREVNSRDLLEKELSNTRQVGMIGEVCHRGMYNETHLAALV